MPTAGTASAATGVISMTLLTAVVVLGVLVNRKGRLPGLPRFAGLHLHRYVALLATGFLAVHIVTAVVAPNAGIRLAAAIIPFASARDPFWLGLGAVSFDLLIALVVTSLLRRHMGRRAWRAVHWLAYLCWPVALAHSVGIGPGMRHGRLLDLTAACVLAVGGAVAWRLIGALRPAKAAGRAGRAASAPERVPAAGQVPAAEQAPAAGQAPAAQRMQAPEQAPAALPVPVERVPAAEPAGAEGRRLRVNPIACSGHGLCAELLPELIALDTWGYPVLADRPVPAGLARRATRAVTDCPELALRLAGRRQPG